MINESLRKSWPIIDLCESQEKKMKGKCTWQKLQEDKHNCNNQNKAWSYWHITLTFLSDTCTNLVFALFLLFGANLINGNKVRSSHAACHSDICVHSLSVFKSKAIQHTFNYTKYPKLQRTEVRKCSIQPPPCHYSPSPRINTRHTHLALPIETVNSKCL